MKIIITEDQVESLKKIKVLEKYIDHILSEYPWYEGIDWYKVEPFRFRGQLTPYSFYQNNINIL